MVASVFPEWAAGVVLGSSVYPLPCSFAAAASSLFPAAVQAYYDEVLEPLFGATSPALARLAASVPAPAALAVLAAIDVALVSGFVLWSVAAPLRLAVDGCAPMSR